VQPWCEQLLDAASQPEATAVAGVRVADSAGATLVEYAHDEVFAAF
jgi:hypothetical protein